MSSAVPLKDCTSLHELKTCLDQFSFILASRSTNQHAENRERSSMASHNPYPSCCGDVFRIVRISWRIKKIRHSQRTNLGETMLV